MNTTAEQPQVLPGRLNGHNVSVRRFCRAGVRLTDDELQREPFVKGEIRSHWITGGEAEAPYMVVELSRQPSTAGRDDNHVLPPLYRPTLATLGQRIVRIAGVERLGSKSVRQEWLVHY